MLVFIDESGYPVPNDDCKNSVLACICMREDDLRRVTSEVHKLKTSIFGENAKEFKSTEFINKNVVNKPLQNKKEFTEKLVQLIADYNMKVFAVVMDRPEKKPFTEPGMLSKQYYYLLKRVEYYCKSVNRSEMFLERALFIFDETDKTTDRRTTRAFLNFLYKANEGKGFDHILELPLFVDSEATPGIQIVDFAAGIIRKYYELELHKYIDPLNEHHKWLANLYNILKTCTVDFNKPNGKGKEYGIVTGIRLDK